MKETIKKHTNIQKKLIRWKNIIAAVVILFLFSASLFYIALTQEEKADPISEKLIRKRAADWLNEKTTIHKEPNELNDDDFAKITTFGLGGKDIWDIKLLEKFTNLNEFEIHSVHYPERLIPGWMKILEKYCNFNLDERFTLDLGPLGKLSNLEILNLNSSPVKNIKPLSNLIDLKHLILNSTLVTDLEPVKGMINLDALYLVNTKVSNLEPLMEHKNLKRLYISGCKNIKDKQVENLQKACPNLRIFK